MKGEPDSRPELFLGSSLTLNRQLGSLQGTGLGPLHVCNSCVAWSVLSAPRSGITTCHPSLVLELVVGMPCPALVQGEELGLAST